MAKGEFYLLRTVSGFQPATEQDMEAVQAFKVGDVIRVMAQKPRNGRHHRKGFALLQLGFNYWEPPVSLLTAGERHMAQVIAERLDAMGGGSGVIVEQVAMIAKEMEDKRRDQIGELEKSFDAFRKDITIRAGFYEVEMSPNGIQKRAKSLAFDKMPQEEFSKWYKAAFGVLWNMILSRHFPNEQEAEKAACQLLEFV